MVIDAVVNNVAVQNLEKTRLKEIRMSRKKPKRRPYGSKFKEDCCVQYCLTEVYTKDMLKNQRMDL